MSNNFNFELRYLLCLRDSSSTCRNHMQEEKLQRKKLVTWLHSPARHDISIATWFPWCPKRVTESGSGVRLNRSCRPSRMSSRAFQVVLLGLLKRERFAKPSNFSFFDRSILSQGPVGFCADEDLGMFAQLLKLSLFK